MKRLKSLFSELIFREKNSFFPYLYRHVVKDLNLPFQNAP